MVKIHHNARALRSKIHTNLARIYENSLRILLRISVALVTLFLKLESLVFNSLPVSKGKF